MESILRNGLAQEGLTSLRKTRTSEVSTFVKNYNQAQTRSMRKEVEVWYKDTSHTLRSMNGRQQKLYSSLLKLSKAKKMIKTRREDEERQKRISNDFEKKRKELRARRERHVRRDEVLGFESVDILQLDQNDVNTLISKPENFHGNSYSSGNNDDVFDATTRQLDSDKTNGDKRLTSTSVEISESPGQCDIHRRNSSFHDAVLDIIEEANIPIENETISRENVNPSVKSLSTATKENISLPPVRIPANMNRYRTTSFPVLAAHPSSEKARVNDLEKYHKGMPLLPEITRAVSVEKKDGISKDISLKSVTTVSNSVTDSATYEPPMKRRKKRRAAVGRNRHPVTSKRIADPSEEIYSKSSIQAMEGKQYDVPIYKRNSKGDLFELHETIDTTVDVAKYFNFGFYRDRLSRYRMLQDAKEKERRQRRRVADFLVKLNQEEEDKRKRAEEKARQEEEEFLAMKKRLESLKKGPPKYGLATDTSTPGYVRRYIRPPKHEMLAVRQERKKSSWNLPSIYSLNASMNGSISLSSSLKSGRNNSVYPQELGAASHLVNINVEKYLVKAVD